jgi:hypothetical protein
MGIKNTELSNGIRKKKKCIIIAYIAKNKEFFFDKTWAVIIWVFEK